MTSIDTKKKYTTPEGVFRFPALIKPDYGNEAVPKPKGQFKTQIVYSPKDIKPFLDMLSPLYENARELAEAAFAKLGPAQRKKLGEYNMHAMYTDIYEKDSEEPTGDVYMSFSTIYSGVDKKGAKWVKKLPIFDSKGKPIVKLESVWGGSKGKISFTAVPYFVDGSGTGGLKFYLEAVQITKLVSGNGGGDADGFGFGEEDGYEREESEGAAHGFEDSDDTKHDAEDF